MLISLLFLNILFLSSCHDNGAYINAGKLSKYSSRKFQVNLSESLNYNYSVFIDCSEFSSHEYIYFKVILHDGEFKDDFIYYSPRNEMYTFLYFELGQPYDSSNSNIRTFQINNPYKYNEYKYLYIAPPNFYGTSIEIQNYYRLSTFLIVGIVLGISAFIIIIIIFFCYYYKKSRKLALNKIDDVFAQPINYPTIFKD